MPDNDGVKAVTSTFWSLLDAPARTALHQAGHPRSFAPQDVILRQNELSDHLLVIRRGCVKVIAYTDLGYQAVLAIRNAGDLLGEQAGLDGGPRSAAVHALTPVEALIVPADRFTTAMHTHPAVGAAVRHVLSARLREADRGRASAAEAVQARLAALLLDLGERYGRPRDGARSDGSGPDAAPGPGSREVRIALPLSQDDLAGLVLSSRRTVSRVLEQWRARGWVETGRRSLVLRELDQLKDQAAQGS
ncbi:Crp/Fnr family transcriptional regulator [Streptomyces sp. 8N706]|uniref:Crp/Fnr family transcriptional regulator n=1 Tax=Streptomyces sp. 8N706 TaxID=3457416 RepID=UPI003FCF6123